MEEEKHKCRLCHKSFVHGRALGGHMRSHPLPIHLESASSSIPDFLQDRESETESSKKPTRKRSRLNRRSSSIYVVSSSLRHQQEEDEEQPMSSVVSDGATPEDEDVAISLMMMSRDTWQNSKEKESDDDDEEKKKNWFKCETCEKVFKTYQALGGHRASHKKKKAQAQALVEDQSLLESNDQIKRMKKKKSHECPICLKVFSSGQALGGHKRSHKGSIISLIDLNLPAPSEEEDLVSSVFNA